MNNSNIQFSTGLPGLDKVLRGLLPGDNIVWQIESLHDYKPFIFPFYDRAAKHEQKVIYFRFAQHTELLPESDNLRIIRLKPENDFEMFINDTLNIIESSGPNTCFIFDCLSELAVDWYSDRMLGNFFLITCPFVYQMKSVAYFSLIRDRHSVHATDNINDKAQVILDVYRNEEKLYVHPLKIYKRHSTTINTLHIWENDEFLPVTSSATISEILTEVPQPWLDFTIHRLGEWTSTFARANELYNEALAGKVVKKEITDIYNRLIRMVVTRDKRFLALAEKYFDLSDLLDIRKRMIGTGLVGGKTVGMLMARAIIKKTNPRIADNFEAHDSFFIGSDVFYTYLVQNDCWWLRRKLMAGDSFLEHADEARLRMLEGKFPQYIEYQFMEMLNYFGQVPIIVRSSSLLEDNYGNSFSGKYDSVFCTNQGTPKQRLKAFIDAVKQVYTSTMNKDVLFYRDQRELLEHDEQMALLVQRVSGDVYNNLFFPQVAGVGYSFNPYVWNKEIDPNAGMLRLVFGLGTRAVDRHDDDYTRIVALNIPQKRPEANLDEVRKYAQHHVDVLDLNKNEAVTIDFEDVIKAAGNFALEMFASRDQEVERWAQERGLNNVFSWFITFQKFFTDTPFIKTMRQILSILHEAYEYPVDIEFSLNFLENNTYRINLLQCRPFQVRRGKSKIVVMPKTITDNDIIFKSNGPVLGNNVLMPIDLLVYIKPSMYSKLNQSECYEVARILGKITHHEENDNKKIMLLGPGRWGTTTPSLGIPVAFSEINKVSVLCEIAFMHDELIPDLSLGTHFYNDLVEMDMTYLGLMPQRSDTQLHEDLILNTPNIFEKLLPDKQKWADIIHVVSSTSNDVYKKMFLYVDAIKHEAICYLDEE